MIHGTVTLGNQGGAAALVQRALITARPPGGTHAGGPFDDFAPAAGPATLNPGDNLAIDATFSLAPDAAPGAWEAYATYQDDQGSYHDTASMLFTVASAVDGGAPADGGTSGSPGPTISAVTASNITQTSALISWTLDQPGTGQVEYGTTTAYGQSTTPELSFNYSAHAQAVTGLSAGTLYHYRARSQNQAGGLSVSGDSTFTTLPASTGAGGLPAKVVGGYFTTWSGSALQTVVDSTNYNLVYVAFATGVSAGSGALQLQLPPGASSAADFKSQIAYANSKGVKVLVSVGGYFDLGGSNSGYLLDSSSKVDEFMVSMRDLRSTWGFNGMDWDLEHGERPDVAGIVDASQRMKTEFGPDWIINAAPGKGLATWVGAGGVLDTLGPGGWDAVGEQIYDLNLSPSDYQAEIISRMPALSNQFGADKVILGNKYRQDSPSAPYEPTNYVPIATTLQALSDLRGSGINIRGSFVWTIQSDGDQSYDWSTGVGGDILSHP